MNRRDNDTSSSVCSVDFSRYSHVGASCPPQQSLVIVLRTNSEATAQRSACRLKMIDRQTQSAIGRQLRILYDNACAATVPDHLVRLLEELDRKDPASAVIPSRISKI